MGLFRDLFGFSLFAASKKEDSAFQEVRLLTKEQIDEVELKCFNKLYEIDFGEYKNEKLLIERGDNFYLDYSFCEMRDKLSMKRKDFIRDGVLCEYHGDIEGGFIIMSNDPQALQWRAAREAITRQIEGIIKEAQRKSDVAIYYLRMLDERKRKEEEKKMKQYEDAMVACYLGFRGCWEGTDENT